MYGRRSNGHEHGTVMTKQNVVHFMLDACNYTGLSNLSNIRLLDPAGGTGSFILSAIDRLHESSCNFEFNFLNALKNLKVIELNGSTSEILRSNIQFKIKELGYENSFDIAGNLVIEGDFLTTILNPFDIIIGNPPYISNQNIPRIKKILYKRLFSVFRNRSDLYIAFFQKSLDLLSEAGKLCFICPDRWLRNTYGGYLRNYISKRFTIPFIVNLCNTNPFEENVLSYPIIIQVCSENKKRKVDYFEIKDLAELDNILRNGNCPSRSWNVNHTRIAKPKLDEIWIFNKNRMNFASNDNFLKLEEQGFKIGIGAATGLDPDSATVGKDKSNS